MIANMRYGQSSVSVDDKDMSTFPNHVFLQIQIQETPERSYRKYEHIMMIIKRFNIAKPVRSRPSELRSTNSTEHQMKSFCKFKFKHQENSGNIIEILL